MITYTVADPRGNVLIRGATVEEAARGILTYDGYVFEIRGNDLWVSHCSRAWHSFSRFAGDDGMDKSIISGTADEIWRKVIFSGWHGCECLTDESAAEIYPEITTPHREIPPGPSRRQTIASTRTTDEIFDAYREAARRWPDEYATADAKRGTRRAVAMHRLRDRILSEQS